MTLEQVAASLQPYCAVVLPTIERETTILCATRHEAVEQLRKVAASEQVVWAELKMPQQEGKITLRYRSVKLMV